VAVDQVGGVRGLNDPEWQSWIDCFPRYTLSDSKNFSKWRKQIEVAAGRPLPNTPLSAIDKTLILTALTQHADRLQDQASSASTAIVILTSASLIAGIGALLFHQLIPIAGILGTVALAKRAWDFGLGGNAGNKVVHDLLTEVAETLP